MRYFLPRFLHPTGGQPIIIRIRILSDNGWVTYRSNARAALALRAPPRRPHDPDCISIESYRTWASTVGGHEQFVEILPEQLARAHKFLTRMASIIRARPIYTERILPPHMLAPAPARPAPPLADAIREVARQFDANRAAHTPTIQPKTNHRIGVPKNKLP